MHDVGPEAVGVCRPLPGQPQGIAPTHPLSEIACTSLGNRKAPPNPPSATACITLDQRRLHLVGQAQSPIRNGLHPVGPKAVGVRGWAWVGWGPCAYPAAEYIPLGEGDFGGRRFWGRREIAPVAINRDPTAPTASATPNHPAPAAQPAPSPSPSSPASHIPPPSPPR